MIKNSNYVLIRKATDKKYEKLILGLSYTKKLSCKLIGLDNGLAYITNSTDSLTENECRGITCILMSEQFDAYYRMFNSSNTLNVYEFEHMHFPDLMTIKEIGKRVKSDNPTIEDATAIFSNFFN